MKLLSMLAITALVCSFANPMHVQAAESTCVESVIETVDQTLAFEDTLLTLINDERAKHGLAPYMLDMAVDAASDARVAEVKSYFTHSRNGGESFATILFEHGISFTSASEVLAAGQTSPELVLNDWLNSPGHAGRILSSKYTRVGVSHERTEDGMDYWEILFIN